LLQEVIDYLKKAIEEEGVTTDQLLGIGLSIPGLFDYTNKEILVSFALGWERVPLAGILEHELGCPWSPRGTV